MVIVTMYTLIGKSLHNRILESGKVSDRVIKSSAIAKVQTRLKLVKIFVIFLNMIVYP